jgi:hypothetical protein
MTVPITNPDDKPVVNNIDSPEIIGQVPEGIDDFLNHHGIKEHVYTCQLKRIPLNGGNAQFLPELYTGSYPSIHDIGKKYGPGKYLWSFNYDMVLDTGRKVKRNKDHEVELGEEFAELHEEYMLELWESKQKRMDKKKQSNAFKMAMRGGVNEPQKDGLDNLKESIGVMKELGMPVGGVPATGDNSGMQQMMMLVMQMQQKSSDNMMTMMVQQNNNMVQLMGSLLGGNRNQPDPSTNFERALGMVQNIMEVKNGLTPERKGAIDKIFDLMEGVLPGLLQMAQQKGISAAQQNPMVTIAKNSPDYQKIVGDKIELDYFIQKMDAEHGQENTDTILKTLGVDRQGNKINPTMDAQGEVIEDEIPNVSADIQSDEDDIASALGD